MNKYINSFESLGEFNIAYDSLEQNNVSYIKDTNDVIFGKSYHEPTEDKTKAQVGDLVFFNEFIYTSEIEGDLILYMDPKDPRISYMVEQATCYGVVVITAANSGDNTVRVVSLDFMDYNNPSQGSKSLVNMMWGNRNTIVPNLPTVERILAYAPGTTTASLVNYSYFATNYNKINSYSGIPDKSEYYANGAGTNSMVPTPYGSDGSVNETYFLDTGSILNKGLVGKANTAAIVAAANYTQGDAITNTEDAYPAACCCYSYMSNDNDVQNAGYYYLPSIAELGFLVARYKEIDFARRAMRRKDLQNLSYWSSSLCSSSNVWRLRLSLFDLFGHCGSVYKNSHNPVLAFIAF